jgi:acylphosphatase
MNKQLEAVVYGRVQGVSFRYYTEQIARRLQLTGWVANQSDGSVLVIAEGPPDDLERFVSFLRVGPPAAAVDEVALTWGVATGRFTHFAVRRL